MIVLWCNGSTAVFGSACLGSNPGKTTEEKESDQYGLTPFLYPDKQAINNPNAAIMSFL